MNEKLFAKTIILYPSIEKRLKKMNVDYRTGYRPDRIPADQI